MKHFFRSRKILKTMVCLLLAASTLLSFPGGLCSPVRAASNQVLSVPVDFSSKTTGAWLALDLSSPVSAEAGSKLTMTVYLPKTFLVKTGRSVAVSPRAPLQDSTGYVGTLTFSSFSIERSGDTCLVLNASGKKISGATVKTTGDYYKIKVTVSSKDKVTCIDGSSRDFSPNTDQLMGLEFSLTSKAVKKKATLFFDDISVTSSGSKVITTGFASYDKNASVFREILVKTGKNAVKDGSIVTFSKKIS